MRHNSTLRKTVARLLAVGLMIGVCVLVIQAAVTNKDISSEVGVNNLGVAYSFDDGKTGIGVGSASFTPSTSTQKIGLTVKSYSAWGANNCTPGNLTLILTNNYDSKAELSFDYTVSETYGTWIVGTEKGVVSKTRFLVTLDGHSDFTITITTDRSKNGAKNGVVMTITNIQLVEQVFNVNTTFLPPEQGGSYSVDGRAITSKEIIPNKSNYVYNLAATPATGYVFAGWKNADTGAYFSGDASISRAFTENSQIQPVFVPEGSAQFGVGSQRFYNLNVANKYAVANDKSKIVLLQSGPLLAENYEISKGVTLLIPYDQSGMENETTHEATPATVDSANSNRTAFRTLTIPSGATLTVNGAINVDGQVLSNGSIPTGPYGLITLHRGSAIVLNDGGKLYCWGYINGDGVVSANANSAVYECFQLAGWRGGSDSLNMNNNSQKVFPVNQYYVQNVEARLEFNYGASEYVFASVTVNVKVATAYASTTEVYIGKDKGMFRPDKEGSVLTKKYVPATDRTEFEVKGDMTINTMTLDLVPKLGSVSFSAFAVKLATGSYVLPINSGFSVNIYSGTTTIAKDQDIALLPGAEFTVSEGAEFVAASNMYVYDHDQWAGQKYAYGFYGYGACDLAPVGYSTTNGTSVIRSADKEGCLKDAVIDVNGTMTIKGNIYTTSCDNNVPGVPDTAKGQVSCGAYIFSTGGNGVVVFNNKYPDTIPTTHQYQQTSKTYSDIACNPAWLRNGDGTYTETAGAQAGWTYKYDTVQQRWYRFRVNYQFNGKDIGYDLITTDTVERDVSNYVNDGSSLVGTVTSGTANPPTISGGTLKVTGVGSDCTINITGVAASYTPYFVLNEHQYSVYLSYGGTKITNKVTIDKKTYYVVKSYGTMAFGTALSAPSNETMGVSADRHNSITWFLEDVTTGAQQFMDTVPSGKDKGGPVYIYGIYNGAVAHNSYTNEYYTNLKDAIVDLPVTGSATLTMYANCGTFEDESKTASYSLSANITFNVNGKEAWGSLVNNGTLTLVDAKGGKIITEAASTNGSLQNYASVVRNNGTLTMEGVTLVGTQTTNDYFAGVMNYTGGKIVSMKDCNVKVQRGYGLCNYGGTIDTIDGGSITGKYGINNRNYRTVGVSNGVAPQLGAVARIGTIQNTNVTATAQYALWNGGTIDTICGNAEFHNTGSSDHIVYNSNSWFYDTYVASRTDSTSNGFVRTDTYITDDARIPTIGTITGNVVISSDTCRYGLSNCGNIGTISGNVQIAAKSYALNVIDGGKINSINGDRIMIKATAGERGVNVSGQKRAKTVTTYQKAIGDTATKIETTYDRASSIGTITGNVTISATGSYGVINYGTIDAITGSGVKIQANATALYNIEGARILTEVETRTNLGKIDTVTSGHYLTLREIERTYAAPHIGAIDSITIASTGGYGLYNQGTIDEVKNVNVTSSANAVNNSNGYYTQRKCFTLAHGEKEFGTTSYIWEANISYTRNQPKIDKLTGVTATTTSTTGALNNTGIINTIDSCTFTAQKHNALSNSLCVTGYYLGDHASAYEQYKAFISEGSSYVFRATDSTSAYTRGQIGSITNTKLSSTEITSEWVAVLDNTGYIGTIGAGTTITLNGASGTPATTKNRLYAIRVSDNCYATKRTVYKDVTNAIQSLGKPVKGNYYRQDDFSYTYTDGVRAEIGDISGVTISNNYGYGVWNCGKIGSVGQDTSISAYNHAVCNSSGSYTERSTVRLTTGTTLYSEDSCVGESNCSYKTIPAEITLINGATIETIGSDGGSYFGISNSGHIGTIKNTNISAAYSSAIRNTGKTNLTYKVEYAGNGVSGINPYIVWDTSKTKYVFATTYSSTNSYSATCTPCVIDLIGEDNTLTSKNYTIFNSGIITEINGGTSKNTVAATGTSGVGINNYRGTNATEKFVAGSGTCTYNSATIGTIANTKVTATVNALVNSDSSSNYTAVAIRELGTGNMFESGKDCVVNNNNGSINTITGGTFTATSTDTYALKNNNTSAAIAISVGPTFLGGTDSRSYAIYEPDKAERQSYPKDHTLSNKPNKDGYYYIAEKKFVLKFDANGSTTYPATGTVDAMTVTLPAESVTLPANGFTRSGYIFAGWALDKNIGADNAKKLLAGSIELSKLGDPGAGDEVTLYAIWKPNKVYNVTVNWNGTLAYTYVPSVYQWDAQNLRYKIHENSYWKGENPTVTVTNVGGNEDGVTYGSINAGIGYTKKTGYDTFDMNFYIGDETVAYKSKATLASGLMPGGQSAKARMELIGTLPSGMAQGTLTIGTVALTLTTAD